uniref:Peptidase S1 domain-containing protein n=1 Tax=Pelusios castaneus TaxID=367368 RepID=A0A8C8S306_9SAUR
HMMMLMLILLLLPVAFLLPPGAGIIGGWDAKPHSRPYMIALSSISLSLYPSLGFRSAPNTPHIGLGFHSKITVYLGAHNIRKEEPSQQVISARRWIPHQQFNVETNNNDIMLVHLEHKATFNEYVRSIRLPLVQQQVPPGTLCSIAGWGWTNATSGHLSATLQEVDVVVMPNATCNYVQYNPSMMVCVGDPKEGKGSFQGDSGGALVCGRTAQGIFSFGSEDGTPPMAYTRVSTFIPWIQETMRRLQP